ncbi:hypothetical protein [Brachyspira pulli]|uniref:hypothetical protein n=1 Tax=Brachyspira pulli TaxID=310721 RepID=UPI003005B529
METLKQLYEEFQNENIYLYDSNKILHNMPCKYCGKNFKQGDYIIQNTNINENFFENIKIDDFKEFGGMQYDA